MKTRHYIQLPLALFRQMFPDKAEPFPTSFDEDPRYLVRYDFISGLIEIGYEDDKWLIQ